MASQAGGVRTSSAGPLVDAILEGKAPRAVRMAAARGALPVDRPTLYRLLVNLAGDGDEEIRAEAGKNLNAWPRSEMDALAADPGAHPDVLTHLLHTPSGDGSLLAAVLANPSTPPEALAEAAAGFSAEKLEVLLLNQTLLIANPGILDVIEKNPGATPLHRARVEEIRRHFLSAHPAAPAETPAEAPGTSPEIPATPRPPEEQAAGSGPRVEPLGEEPPQAADAGVEHPAPHAAEEPDVKSGVYQRILHMNLNEKINLATKGTKEERIILIREANRAIQEAVVHSPKLTEPEVEAIAKMRNINEDVLRFIARNRDWMKNYSVVHGLAHNPKTPLGISMGLLMRLTTKDLKLMTKDKNIPETLRRTARKQLEARSKRPGGGL